MRVQFCGVIEGSVNIRPGESESDAIARAETQINSVLARYAKTFARTDENENEPGPIVGLESR